ncbi:MAG: tetratricopeptide repeat protein [Candidatus Sericytochromatia bacterium]
MLDLKELSLQSQKLQSRNQLRQDDGKVEYHKAIGYLKIYISQPKRETLLLAIQALMQASRLNRSDPMPYVLLGRLYWSMGLTALALQYLKASQFLAPDLPAVNELCELLTTGQKPETFSDEASPDRDSEDPDFDALYDELEKMIQTELHFVMGMNLDLKPSTEPNWMDALAEHLKRLRQSSLMIDENLRMVDLEFDTSELKQLFRPVELRLKQLENLLILTQKILDLLTQIRMTLDVVDAQLNDSNFGETHLENILDQCDSFADQIDDLQSQGCTTFSLENQYEVLVEKLNLWQDKIDQNL